ncbi:MAG: SurA N-terminal domain-containing protein [Gammaproteobacteria bacterium]|nr:SurA N-terminal domain-containing protein [Gammaproteobacteria bacterium]MBQ0838963.1 SurA N-terminal domain-containing protein [Gammaproteobacteria bacterium]
MLQDFREGMKGIAFFIVILIIVPFAFVGIDSIFSNSPASDAELEVDGHSISRLVVDRALAIHKQRLLQRLGDIDPALLDDAMLRGPVKERLIKEKAAELTALSTDMGVSPATIASLLQTVDVYQSAGKFDRDKYEFAIRQMGYTPREHHDYMSNGLLLSQFASGVVDTGFVTDADLELAARIFEQRRNYYYLTVPIAPLVAETKVEDAEVKAYYESHKEAFRTEERLAIDYIQLSANNLLDLVEVDEVMVRELFDARQQMAQAAERRRVAHILVEPTDDASQAAEIADIQAKLAAGGDFAALAREHSDDLGSAEQGGDLGFVESGAFPAEFETAILALSEGEISKPVTTDSGIHLIRLTELEKTQALVFEDEKAAIETKLKGQLAAELLPQKIEQLRELSYNAETLEEPAQEMGLVVATTEPFPRSGGSDLAAYPAIVSAAYAEDVLNNGYTSDIVELDDAGVVVLKVRKHYPVAYRPFASVAADITASLKHESAKQALAERARALQAQIANGKSIEKLAQEEGLAWQVNLDTTRFDKRVDEAIRDHAFGLPASSSLPATSGFGLASGDYVILSVAAIHSGELDKISAARRDSLAQSASRTLAQREYQGYESLILADATVKMDK